MKFKVLVYFDIIASDVQDAEEELWKLLSEADSLAAIKKDALAFKVEPRCEAKESQE